MKKIIIFGILLLFLNGCFTPNMQGPCCTRNDALNGMCAMFTPAGADANVSTENCNGIISNGLNCKTEFCVFPEINDATKETVYRKYYALGSSVVNETVNCTNISLSNTSHPCNNIGYCFLKMYNTSTGQSANASYPICSDRTEKAIDEKCKTMLCGNIKYNPQHSILPEPNKNPLFQNLGDAQTINLYNARCGFYVLDDKTMKKLRKSSGVFINTFRVGIGSSISDFEQAKVFFPLSDRFCGFTSEAQSSVLKDRYMNYLNLTDVKYNIYIRSFSGTGSGSLKANSNLDINISYDADKTRLKLSNSVIKELPPTPEPGNSRFCLNMERYTRICNDDGCRYSWVSAGSACTYGVNTIVYTHQGSGESNLRYNYNYSSKQVLNSSYYGSFDPSQLKNRSTCATDMDFVEHKPYWVNYSYEHNTATSTVGVEHEALIYIDYTDTKTYLGIYGPSGLYAGYGEVNTLPPLPRESVTFCGYMYGDHSSGKQDCTSYGWQCTNLSQKSLAVCDAPGMQWPWFAWNYSTPQIDACTHEPLRRYYGLNYSDCNNIVFPPAPDGNYLLTSYTEGTGGFTNTYILPGAGAYKYNLYRAYWDQIYNRENASFECSSASNCISGVCSKEDNAYERGWCISGEKTLKAGTGSGAIQGMQDYLNISIKYNSTHAQFVLLFRNDSGMDKAVIATLLRSELPEGSTVSFSVRNSSSLPANCLGGYNITTGGEKSVITCTGGIHNIDYTFNYSVKSSVPANCLCYEVGIRQPQSNPNPNNKVYCEPIKNSTSFNNLGATIASAGGSETVPAGSITFFSSPQEGYIGYALMDETDFNNSMFATECGPINYNVDYNVYSHPGPYALPVDKPYWWSPTTFPGNMWDSLGCIQSHYERRYVGGCGEDSPFWCDPYKTYWVCDSTYTQLIRIKNHSCMRDDGEFGIETKTFPKLTSVSGWCEPCTFLTMVGINLDEQWNKYSSYSYVGGGCCGQAQYVADNLAIQRNRIDAYLKAGVMPVIWYPGGGLHDITLYSGAYNYWGEECGWSVNNCGDRDVKTAYDKGVSSLSPLPNIPYSPENNKVFLDNLNSGCWCHHRERNNKPDCSTILCQWSGTYNFFHHILGNSAAIVIIATDGMNGELIGTRSESLKAICPNCIATLYSSSASSSKLDSIFGCNGEFDCQLKGTKAWKNIDLIAFDEKFNNYVGENREDVILNGTTAKSRELLKRYSKPSFAYNLVIDDTANNWVPYNNTFNTLKYLFSNQNELVNSGQIAFFYKNWKGTNTEALVTPINNLETYKDMKFCAVEQTINNYLVGTIIKTVFTTINSVNETECTECSSTDTVFGFCSEECENGVKCTLPQGITSYTNYKCPQNTVLEPCRLCNDSYYNNKKALCNLSYPDGTITPVEYNIQDLTDIHGDIIASLAKQDKCCLSSYDDKSKITTNYTYIKMVGEGTLNTPIRFPRSGIDNYDCGITTAGTTFCGYTIPVKDYKIECAIN